MANGFFLGGAATGMSTAFNQDIAQQGQDRANRQQDMAQNQQDFSQKQAVAAQVDKQISATMQTAADTIKAITEAGKDPNSPSAQKAIAPLIESAAALAGRVYGPEGSDRIMKQGQALFARPPSQSDPSLSVVQTGEDPIAGKQYHVFNKKTGELTPIQQPQTAPVPPDQSINLTGEGKTITGVDVQNAPAATAAPAFPPSQSKLVQALVDKGYTTQSILDFKAMRYNLGDTSVVSSMGRSKAAAVERKAIIDRGTEIAMYLNQHPEDVNARKAQTVAASQALNQMTKMKYSIKQFEDTAIANGDALVELAKKVDQTGVPVVERWTRAGRQAIAGDEDVSQFNTQMTFYRTEIAKVLVAGNIVGSVLTDDARHEVERALPDSSSFGQIKKAHELIKADFARRNKAIDTQIANINQSFGTAAPPAAAPTAPTPQPHRIIDPGSGIGFTIHRGQ